MKIAVEKLEFINRQILMTFWQNSSKREMKYCIPRSINLLFHFIIGYTVIDILDILHCTFLFKTVLETTLPPASGEKLAQLEPINRASLFFWTTNPHRARYVNQTT